MKSAIKNYKLLARHLEKMRKAPKQVIQRTISDVKTRGPGWIATEVAGVYNVKKAELKPGAQSLGSIKVKGIKFDNIQVIYSGRRLTPAHFNMTPKTPKQSYTLKAEIVKGQKKRYGQVKKLTKKQKKNIAKNFRREGTQNSNHSPIMMMHTGNTKAKGGVDYIPFQRKSSERKDIKAIKTVALPQMVSSKRVDANISRTLNENLSKRLEHHMKTSGMI